MKSKQTYTHILFISAVSLDEKPTACSDIHHYNKKDDTNVNVRQLKMEQGTLLLLKVKNLIAKLIAYTHHNPEGDR